MAYASTKMAETYSDLDGYPRLLRFRWRCWGWETEVIHRSSTTTQDNVKSSASTQDSSAGLLLPNPEGLRDFPVERELEKTDLTLTRQHRAANPKCPQFGESPGSRKAWSSFPSGWHHHSPGGVGCASVVSLEILWLGCL